MRNTNKETFKTFKYSYTLFTVYYLLFFVIFLQKLRNIGYVSFPITSTRFLQPTSELSFHRCGCGQSVQYVLTHDADAISCWYKLLWSAPSAKHQPQVVRGRLNCALMSGCLAVVVKGHAPAAPAQSAMGTSARRTTLQESLQNTKRHKPERIMRISYLYTPYWRVDKWAVVGQGFNNASS